MIYTQEQLEAMSNHELNAECTMIAQGCKGWELSESNMSFYHCGIDGSGFYEQDILNYCGDWVGCGKLIDELAINLYKAEGPDFMPWVASKGVISSTQHNPKKAVVIVYILVKQGQQND